MDLGVEASAVREASSAVLLFERALVGRNDACRQRDDVAVACTLLDSVLERERRRLANWQRGDGPHVVHLSLIHI